jgi:Skp family chaperone for outer membrane proteins
MRIISLSMFLVLIVCHNAYAQGQQQQRIGVVRVADAMAKTAEGAKVAQSDATRRAAAQQDRMQHVKELQDMSSQLGQFKRGTPQYNELFEKFQARQDEYEVWLKRTERSLASATKQEYQRMYEHVREATKQIATQRQLTLVLNDTAIELGPTSDQISPEQFGAALAQRPLVFADDSIDITTDVITKADANFTATPGAPVQGK